MESFIVAMLAATAAAFVWLLVLAVRGKTSEWAKMPLPFGTFLSIAALAEVFYPQWILSRLQLGF
jgi:prepilin signal peptidase PulO-like enzyme (type II secretory pathway)